MVFPVASEQTLQALVKEWKATGPTYRRILRTVIRSSYASHYRQIVPQLLRTLTFCSNNDVHRPVIEALDLIKRYADKKLYRYPLDEAVPLDGVVRGLWRDAVIDIDREGRPRVNRITYEICALQALREKLRCKEIWVLGANRFRNPEEDLPRDFEQQREAYYASLRLPPSADTFVSELRDEMRSALLI